MKQLLVWVGPVASEKTTRALRHARRVDRKIRLPYVIRPTKSVRAHERNFPGYLVTKGGEQYPSLEVESARDLVSACRGFKAVWIDEPMLFEHEPEVFEAVIYIRQHALVLLSGCAATSELEPFGSSLPRLMAVADHVEFCKADCDECGVMGAGTRSRFKLGQKSGVVVGGEESYEPRCPACWTKAQQALTAPVG